MCVSVPMDIGVETSAATVLSYGKIGCGVSASERNASR